ncbi:MAG TPA: hypothetical protein VMR76_01635 [Candidatus Saccharimonadia bacterium]|nr:hypothetical protein [Candidatus Saccharimonadia bacterium]
MPEGISKELAHLEIAENWINLITEYLTTIRGYDIKAATGGARWAAVWKADFNQAVAELTPPLSLDELAKVFETTRVGSSEKCSSLLRYPLGIPSLRTTGAAMESFCLSFGDEESS